MHIPITEINGRLLIAFLVKLPKNLLIIKPKHIGIIMTITIEINIEIISTLIVLLNKRYVMVGVRIGAKIVLILVILTDKATSPLDKYVITLLDVPPGQVPTRITPTVRAGSRLKTLHNMKAIAGIIVNCAMHPIITSLGLVNISLKSSSFNVRPIPNIIIISSQFIQDKEIHKPV